jgi:FAD/FMN-containing dehydrogenase
MDAPTGPVIWRGDPGYEEAWLAASWNARKPDRYPDVIVKAANEDDVVAAVRLAAEHGLKVKARAGGHSWTASGIREGMLIDLSALTAVEFDRERGTARVQPAATGAELNAALAEHDLFFPSGHCPTVGLGGFLLAGGWGWNSRAIGPACLSIVAIDVVTASGETIHADEHENSDWLWAARGAGPGYFGIVTGFELKCYPRPAALYARTDVYALEDSEEVLRWAMEFEPTLPAEFEFAIMATQPVLPGGRVVHDGTALMVMCMVLMDDHDEAREAIGRLDECPLLARAIHREEAQQIDFAGLYEGPDMVEPAGVRWAVDNLWTDAGADEIVPPVAAMIAALPTPESHVFWYPWRPQSIENAALSVQANLFVAAYAGWQDPAEDGSLVSWPVEQVRRLEPFETGIQLSDENLVARPGRYLSVENEARLEELRAAHDPDGRFHSFLTATSDR